MLEPLFWLTVATLGYSWCGYRAVLEILTMLVADRRQRVPAGCDTSLPSLTVIIPVFQGARLIERRIHNVLEQDYPPHLFDVVVASDGSSDRTVEAAARVADPRVRVEAFPVNRGRAAVHSDTVPAARGPIVVFTDADSEFEPGFLRRIVAPFHDPHVGVAVGQLRYRPSELAINRAERCYWAQELRLKQLESRVGLVTNGCGAGMAIRRDLFRPLAGHDDVDTASVIDILFAGYRAVYVPEAIVLDSSPSTPRSEFRMRIRATSKMLKSLALRAPLSMWLAHPVLAWSIGSHRVLRYPTLALLALLFALNTLLLERGPLYQTLWLTELAFGAAALLGGIGERLGRSIPVASLAFSFSVAIAGMAVGVARALTGRAPTSYRPTT